MDEKVTALLEDNAFLESIVSMENPEDVQKAFKEKGVDLTIDEIKEFADAVDKRLNGEISEEDLEGVAGGVSAEAVGKGIDLVVGVLVKLGDSVNTWTRGRW